MELAFLRIFHERGIAWVGAWLTSGWRICIDEWASRTAGDRDSLSAFLGFAFLALSFSAQRQGIHTIFT